MILGILLWLQSAAALPGRLAAWCVIGISAGVITSVLAGVLRITNVATFGTELPLLGRELTLNGLLELNWHFFSLMTMAGLAWVLAEDRHIRVDVLRDKLSARGRVIVDLVGDVLLLLPFSVLMAQRSMPIVDLAWRTGEQSNDAGLIDRWMVKALLPGGFALLAALCVLRILIGVAKLTAPVPAAGGRPR